MDKPSSHSHKVPYARKEGRKSLFSKMKDSMRDMLSPSWLSDLVHTVKKNSPSKDELVSDKGLSEGAGLTQLNPPTPAHGFQGQSTSQPGLGMTNLSTSLGGSSGGPFMGNGQPRMLEFPAVDSGSSVGSSPYQQGNYPPPIAEFTSAQLPLTRITDKTDSMLAQEDAMSQRSDVSRSTSGCSSMIPQSDMVQSDHVRDKRKALEAVDESLPEQQASKRQKLSVGGANQTFSRRLSDTFMHKPSVSMMGNRPAFNTSLFGSPLNNESSLLGTSFHESSFYPGKTTFGGRSSLSFRHQRKKVDLNQSLPGRLSVPVKAFMKAKPRLNPSQEAVTSSTAKRILEALDRMPTPVNDAKRIPVAPRQWLESPSFFSQDSHTPRRTGPPRQKLNISTHATVVKNRQVSFAPVTQSTASGSETSGAKFQMAARQDTVRLESEASATSGKMKRDKSYHRGSASAKPVLEEDDTIVIPDLRTEFTLPVKAMPKFSFTAAVPAQTKLSEPVTKSTPPSVDQSAVTAGINKAAPEKPALNFTFSSPIMKQVPENKPPSPEKYTGFQFSSPIHIDEKKASSVPEVSKKPTTSALTFNFSSPSNKMEFNFSTAPKPKPKLNGPTEPSGGGFQAAAELKQGSVMDILGGGNKSTSSSSSSGSAQITQQTQSTSQGSNLPPLSALFKSSGWACTVCLINNKDDAVKCSACQSARPGGVTSASSKMTTTAPSLSTLFKPSGWKCDVCLVNNNDSVNKCAACQSLKPGGSGAPLSSLFKSSGWLCDVCLVQNKDDVNKCAACQSPKPGPKVTEGFSSSPLVTTIQPGNWVCNSCLIQNKKDDTVCGACKAPRSAGKASDSKKSDDLFAKFKSSSGTWDCEACLVKNKPDSNSCAACQTPKPLKFFKHPPGEWTCDTCLVSNKETAVNCIACNYARPGPPRTHAVPSIAKSFSLPQSFSLPASSESSSISISSTGGFKLSTPASTEVPKSGFDTSKSLNDASASKPSGAGFKFDPSSFGSSSGTSGTGFKFDQSVKPSSGSGTGFKFDSSVKPSSGSGTGFKFDSSVKPSSESGTGFKFGAPVVTESEKTSSGGGGFKFGTPLTSDSEKQDTFSKIENNGPQTETKENPFKSAVFQFGKSDSSLSSVQSSVSTGTLPVFGQKSETAPLEEQVQTTTSVPGGFSFKPSDSVTSAKSIDSLDSSKIVTSSYQNFGGFNSAVNSSTSNPSAVSAFNSIGGFQFTATKVTSPNMTVGSSLADNKPASGLGFSFGQKTDQTITSIPVNNFAQQSTSVTSPKRGRDEGTDEPEMKKQAPAFSFNSSSFQSGAAVTTTSGGSALFSFDKKSTTSPPSAGFAFGQQSSASASSTSFAAPVFGLNNSTTVSNPSLGSTFVFGGAASSNSASQPVFGQSNVTTAATSAAPLFQYGQASGTAPTFNSTSSTSAFSLPSEKTESANQFKFSAQATQPTPATTPAFGGGSLFGSGSAPVFGSASAGTGAFGGNVPSTTPAFGATPPAFGSSNSTTGQATPVFGAFSNGGQQPAAPAQVNSVFQFGAKPAESTPAAAPPTGFNFSASQSGLGANFNFSAQAPSASAFNFSATGPATPADRKIKKAVRKIRR